MQLTLEDPSNYSINNFTVPFSTGENLTQTSSPCPNYGLGGTKMEALTEEGWVLVGGSIAMLAAASIG
jgi:hypothetical protein